MKKTFRNLFEILFARTLPFRAKLFNILVAGGFFIALFICISGFATGASFVNSLLSGITAVFAALLLLVGLKTGRYQVCLFIGIVLVFFIFYPVLFFSAGGYRSGMPSFFVFAVVFTVFMLEGRKALIIAFLEIVYYAGLCLAAYFRPDWVIHFATPFSFALDALLGMIGVSAVLGVTLFAQLRMYNRQQQELEDAYRDLEEQTRLAESVSRTKSEFLAQMSHEIRTPMNAILGMSHLALQEDLRPQAREYVENIRRAGDNLMSIINDILDLSRIESGMVEIVPGEYQLASLINDSLTIIRTRLYEKPVRMFTMIDGSLPRQLLGDEARIRQILLNLLSNAVKYTQEGHIMLGIRGARSAGSRKITLEFEVTDTGVGIKPEDMGKLFGSFVRIDAGQNQGIEGTGLGLAICWRLCQFMGGDITAHSVYGVGSTFTASLPQTIVDERPFAELEDPQDKPALIYKTRRISGESLGYTLEKLGVSYALADSREALAEFLERETWRFVFMPSAMYAEFCDVLEEQKILAGESALASLDEIVPVIFAEYGEAIRADIKTLMTPIHPGAVAGILNGRPSNADYNRVQKSGVRFTAPDARILVVDDLATNLDVIAGLLSPYGVKIDRALDGPGAIRLIRENRYDMVFMDHMMSGMDGIEATEIIRKGEGDYFKDLIIIALTANAISGIREMFLARGFNDYLSKPIDLSRLDGILAKWIPREKQQKFTLPHANFVPVCPIRIEGVDSDRGLALTGGTVEGYRKVLARFYKDVLERLSLLQEAPDKQGLPFFTTQAHALKSAAATIGAADLSAEAERLETAGRDGDRTAIREGLKGFRERLEALAEGIRRALEGNPPAGPEGEERGLPELSPLWRNLAEALQAEELAVIDSLLEELSRKPLDGKTREALDSVSDDVLIAEYGSALETVTILLEKEMIGAE
ncbi:MAG: response regulator [Treponema sp.]|jgi:signal transduction histidine kinase/CheY-like chemotaxis protein|nr:response regulator [Treponema sp.]